MKNVSAARIILALWALSFGLQVSGILHAQTVPYPPASAATAAVATTVTPTRTAVAAAGGVFTADLSLGPQNVVAVTLVSGANTATVSGSVAGGRYLLEIVQPTGGADGTVTWPAEIHWPGGVAPVLTTTDARVDLVACYRAVTNLYCESSLNYVP